MTSNYRRVTSQNTWLFEEAVRNGGPLSNNTQYTRDERAKKGFFTSKAGPGTKSRKRALQKYEGVRNSCPVCHLAMPANGECC
jgi:hypothetical protein